MKSHFVSFFRFALVGVVLVTAIFQSQFPAYAAASLSVTPITWNVIGLDSNNVNVGPNDFPVGARVCNTGDAPATNVTANFVWDTNPVPNYINIRPGTNTSLSVASLSNVAPNNCTDFYFEVEVTRSSLAYGATRDYHISVSADGGITGSTPTPRTLYVEHLVSQNRNGVRTVEYGTSLGSLTSVAAGGTMTLVVGSTYYIRMSGFTATNGYEQIESFINIPNTIFQVLDVETGYNVDSSSYVSNPNDKLYGDACKWENDPSSPNYRTCLDVGKDGGDPITVTYQVKILKVPSAPLVNPEPLTNLIYDFSGSSYHYNSDFSVSTRYANIISPATITKSFSPNTIVANATSTLTYTITNISTSVLNNVNFADTTNWPAGLTVSGNQTITYTGCGSPTPSSVSNGAASFSVTGITLLASGTCTFSFLVTSAVDGTYTNTTNDLFIDDADTGNKASASLVVSSLPAPPSSCTTPSTIATWTMPTSGQGSGGPPPPYTTKASDVSSATASATLTGLGSQSIVAAGAGGTTNAWNITDAYSTLTSPPGVASGPYFQFSLDTSNYGGAHISFDFDLEGSGDWASNTNNHIYIYSSSDGSTFSLVRTLGNADGVVKGSWVTSVASATAASTSTSTTYFRITADSRSGSQTTSSIRLDNITITGCPRPTPPTLAKSFSPTSIGTDTTVSPATTVNYSTLTYTIGNTNSSAMTGVAFTDTLPDGIVVANPPTVSAFSCTSGTMTGTVTATAGSSTISLSAGSLPAGASTTCTFSVRVQGKVAGSYTNITNRITATESGANTTGGANVGYGQASLTVVAAPVIAKSFTANPIFTGDMTTLTFSIHNPNTSATLNGISFTDTLPLGLDVVAAAPSSQCGGTLTVTNNVSPAQDTIVLSSGSLIAGDTCYFSVTITGTTAGLYNNSVTVSSTNGGTGNTATAGVLVKAPAPGINLLKQVGSSASGPWLTDTTVAAGSNVYYRFTVENTGDVTLTSVSISDPTVSVAGCTWTDGDGTVLATPLSPPPFALPVADASDNQLATCVIGPFAVGSGSHPNTATASTTQGVSDTSTATYFGTGPNLSLTKTNGATTVTAGSTTTYTLTVTNSGDSASSGTITVVDVLPAGLSIADGAVTLGGAQGPNWSCSAASNVITCTSSTAIAASGISIFSFMVNVDATASGTLVNKAKVGGGGDSTNSSAPDSTTTSACTANDNPEGCALDSDTVDLQTDLAISKDDGALTYTAGNPISYTITVSNNGPSNATGVSVSDTVPASITGTTINCVATGTAGCGTNGSSGNSLSFTGVSINAGAGNYLTITVSGTVSLATTGNLVNTATVTAGPGQTDGDNTNNSSTDTDTPANVTIGNFVWNDVNGNGIQDGGETGLNGVTVNLRDSTGTTILQTTTTAGGGLYSFNAAPGTYILEFVTPSGYAHSPQDQGGDDTKDSDASTSNGQTTTFTLLAGETNNTIDAGFYKPADLSITKDDSQATYTASGSVSYIVTVTNLSGVTVIGATVSDTKPANILNWAWACSSQTGGAAGCTAAGSSTSDFSDTVDLPVGGTIVYTVTANIVAGPSGDLVNTATVGVPSGYIETDSANNSSTDTDALTVFIAPTISKAFAVSNLASGGNTNLTVTIGNSNGSAITLTSNLTDTFPTGMTINTAGNSGTCTGVTATAGAGSFTIASGASIPSGGCTVIVNVTSSTAGAAVNTIPAGALQTSVGNNASAATDTLNVYIPPTLTKVFGAGAIISGGSTTLTLTLGNPGSNPGALTTVRVDDTFPTGLTLQNTTFTFTPAACGTVTNTSGGASAAGDNNIRFSVASLAAGSNCQVDVNVTSLTTGPITNTTNAPTASGPVALTGIAASDDLTVVSIDAKDDTGSTINGAVGGTSIADVLNNNGNGTDLLNGVAATISTVDITVVGSWPAGITLNTSTGAVTVAAGTAAGTYTPQYQICDKANPTICDIATVTVPVVTIDAKDDTGSTVDGATGGTSITNVLNNNGNGTDLLNGVVATTSTVDITVVGIWPAGISLNTLTGEVTVAPGTAAGTYTPQYQICDKLNPTICDTATVTVTVVTIDAKDDTGSTINGALGGTSIANVLNNNGNGTDLLDGAAATTSTVDITIVGVWPAGVTLNTSTGEVTVAPGTATGTYTPQYRICDKANPAICDIATVTVPVVTYAAPLIAKAFSPSTITMGGTSTITFTLTNPNAIVLTNANFTDTLTNMSVSSVIIGGTCVGATNSPALVVGATALDLTVPSLPVSGCTITIDVTSSVVGVHPNTTSGVSSTEVPTPGAGSNTANLTVTGATLFDPPLGEKVLNAELLPELEWRMVWINNSNTSAINVQITDVMPAGTTFVSGSLTCEPRGSSTNAAAATPSLNTALANSFCAYDPIANRIQWQGTIGPDFGATNEATANNEVVITFRVTVPDGLNQVNNGAVALTDRDNDVSFVDESGSSFSASNIASWSRTQEPGGGGGGGNGGGNLGGGTLIPITSLPLTGFAPGAITELPIQPDAKLYSATDIWFEIPSLGVKASVVGVPQSSDGTWDVTWLSKQAGWLQGTAFPTWKGNSAITGHVYLPDGKPGPFVDVSKLRWGDKIIVHAFGQEYTYEVRENKMVKPNDTSVLGHKDDAWLTLLTCQGYNETNNNYANRVAVQAILVSVGQDKDTTPSNRRR